MVSNLTIVLIIIFSLIGIFFLKSLSSIFRLIKNYGKLGHKEFMDRFKEGFEMITPTQKTKAELNGIIITLIGIIIGIIVTIKIRLENVWYWILIILAGSFLMTLFQLISKWQLYQIQKKQDDIITKLNQEQEIENADK